MTDADLLLGYLDPAYFLGGTVVFGRPGGGGIGDPAAREPADRARDLADGLVTAPRGGSRPDGR